MGNMGIQSIKRFFVFRNGIVADTLRKAEIPPEVIFRSADSADRCNRKALTPLPNWRKPYGSDSEVRESRILATYLFPVDEMSLERQSGFLALSEPEEESDMLAFRLLKRLHFASEILKRSEKEPGDSGYAVASLRNHLS